MYLCVSNFHYFYEMILVTGGTGLVGFHLLLQLSSEKEAIRAIYRSEKKRQHIKNLFEATNQLA